MKTLFGGQMMSLNAPGEDQRSLKGLRQRLDGLLQRNLETLLLRSRACTAIQSSGELLIVQNPNQYGKWRTRRCII
jgi:hypothetical protein